MAILGVVICGGQSRRMGQDKGLLVHSSHNTWVESVVEKLLDYMDETIVSINPVQYSNYKSIFADNKIVLDHGYAKGPIEALLSVHQEYPGFDLFIAACDMLFISNYIIEKLLREYNKSNVIDGILYSKQGKIEPLLGIYTQNWLKKIYLEVVKSKNNNFKIKDYISKESFVVFEAQEMDFNSFQNFNYPEDIQDRHKLNSR